MRSRIAVVVFALFASTFLTGAGCGGVQCPEGSTRVDLGTSIQGVKYAEEGFACLTANPAVVGFPVTGLYQYKATGGSLGAPIVQLDAAAGTEPLGTGKFQKHGVSAQSIDWGIMMDPETKVPFGLQTVHGAKILLFYKLKEAGTTECTPDLICDPNNPMTFSDGVGQWDAADLSISFDMQTMYVLGEREKTCETECKQKTGIPPPP